MGHRHIIMKAYEFEDLVRDIFKCNGYNIIAQNIKISIINEIDIIAEKANMKYIIEVKFYRNSAVNSKLILDAIDRLMKIVMPDHIPILVIASILPDRIKHHIQEKGLVHIIDVGNLLYMVENNSQLKSRLLGILEYSTQDIIGTKPTIDLNPIAKSVELNEPNNLINRFIQIKSGKKCFAEYENCCVKILQYLFEEDLTSWNQQYKSNGDLFRFDLVCKIKNGKLPEFWEILKEYL